MRLPCAISNNDKINLQINKRSRSTIYRSWSSQDNSSLLWIAIQITKSEVYLSWYDFFRFIIKWLYKGDFYSAFYLKYFFRSGDRPPSAPPTLSQQNLVTPPWRSRNRWGEFRKWIFNYKSVFFIKWIQSDSWDWRNATMLKLFFYKNSFIEILVYTKCPA